MRAENEHKNALNSFWAVERSMQRIGIVLADAANIFARIPGDGGNFDGPRNEASVANGEGPVFLEAFVAKKLRPHQRDGVRFMPLGFPLAGRGNAWKVRGDFEESWVHPGRYDGFGKISSSLGSTVGGAFQQLGAQGHHCVSFLFVWQLEGRGWQGFLEAKVNFGRELVVTGEEVAWGRTFETNRGGKWQGETWLEKSQNGSLQYFMTHFCGHVSSLQPVDDRTDMDINSSRKEHQSNYNDSISITSVKATSEKSSEFWGGSIVSTSPTVPAQQPITTTWDFGAPRKTETQLREFRDFGSRKLLIVSYDQLRRHVQLVDDVCDLLICDEGHRLRFLAALDKNALKQYLFVSPRWYR